MCPYSFLKASTNADGPAYPTRCATRVTGWSPSSTRAAEPTTFLDLAHQYQLLALLARLRDGGRTVIAVLHDLNQACRYADHLVAMRDGLVAAEGAQSDIVDADLVRGVFDLPGVVVPDPVTGAPMIVPTLSDTALAPPP